MNCTVQCLVLEEHQNFCWCCTTQRLGGGGWGVGDQIFFWGGGSNGVGDPGFPSKKSSFFWGGVITSLRGVHLRGWGRGVSKIDWGWIQGNEGASLWGVGFEVVVIAAWV